MRSDREPEILELTEGSRHSDHLIGETVVEVVCFTLRVSLGEAMAIHEDSQSMMIEAAQEHLSVSEWCISNYKADGGIYGHSAAVLLFCVVDAIGHCLRPGNEPFRILSADPFSLKLGIEEIKQIENWYRNPLVHNAIIAPKVWLTPDDTGDPIEVGSNVTIRVKPLYAVVRKAWDKLDKTRLDPLKRIDPRQFKGVPVGSPSISPHMNATASGTIVIPPPTSGKP
jgi:hypothetical protein